MNVLERIEIAKLNINILNPLLGNLIVHLKAKEYNKVKYIDTDGENLYVNLENVNNLDDKEIEFLILHQLYHIILFHFFRGRNYHNDKYFHMACDYVVNSNIMNRFSIRYYKLKHLGNIPTVLPNNEKASNYTVEQVYNKIKNIDTNINDEEDDYFFEEHKMWLKSSDTNLLNDLYFKWQGIIRDCIEKVDFIESEFMDTEFRELKEFVNPTINWRLILKDFIEEEIVDYSFNPPDKRNSIGNVFLPDFNDVEEKLCNVYFFIDTSASMSDDDITECLSEVKGCVEQYNGRIDAYMAYFDHRVSDIVKLEDVETIENKNALGGGGTSFINIFKCFNKKHEENSINKKKVIILTDGYATFPSAKMVGDIELLWIINNNDAMPNIGEVVRINNI